MLSAEYISYLLNFKKASGTSRGVLLSKQTYFICLKSEGSFGIGECGLFRGLSVDDVPDYEQKLKWACDNINLGLDVLLTQLIAYPSIQFGLEQAFKSLRAEDPFVLFPSDFTNSEEGIHINGLIWMGDQGFMKNQIKQKLKQGFTCIKMKIGAIDFDTELELLKSIRKEFSAQEIELRVDANGAFSFSEALEKLKRLSELKLHSIEQPIKQGYWSEMAKLCEQTPLPIALDEELIGHFSYESKQKVIQTINPQYIILKPSLIGGFWGSEQWIKLANENKIDWWITSALESNIGLNAIAQFTYTLNNSLPQGLGTGGLFTNNIDSPLELLKNKLFYQKDKKCNLNLILT